MAPSASQNPDSSLEVYEQDTNTKPPYILTFQEVKLLAITGVGVTLYYRRWPLTISLFPIGRVLP